MVELFPAGLFTEAGLLPAAFALGLSAQGVKICVDTLVQLNIDDAYRGRVFSLYDVLFNLVFVAAAGVAALVIPDDGKSYAVLICVSAGYALTACLRPGFPEPTAIHEPTHTRTRRLAHDGDIA